MQCQHKVRHRLKMMQGDSSADCQHGISNAAVLQCRVCEITHYSRGHKNTPNPAPCIIIIPPPPPGTPCIPAKLIRQRPDLPGAARFHMSPPDACCFPAFFPPPSTAAAQSTALPSTAVHAGFPARHVLLKLLRMFSSARSDMVSSMTSLPLLRTACKRAACCAAAMLAR